MSEKKTTNELAEELAEYVFETVCTWSDDEQRRVKRYYDTYVNDMAHGLNETREWGLTDEVLREVINKADNIYKEKYLQSTFCFTLEGNKYKVVGIWGFFKSTVMESYTQYQFEPYEYKVFNENGDEMEAPVISEYCSLDCAYADCIISMYVNGMLSDVSTDDETLEEMYNYFNEKKERGINYLYRDKEGYTYKIDFQTDSITGYCDDCGRFVAISNEDKSIITDCPDCYDDIKLIADEQK